MKIGIIGTRGIPNQYGGFEQFAEFVAPELVRRGHEVVVYNSSLHPYKEDSWNGVQIVRRYDPENRLGAFGQFIYDLNCIYHSRSQRFDVLLQLGYTSSSIWTFLFPRKAILVTNMDGLEWTRAKSSNMVRRFLRRAEKWAALYSDALIADSKGIQSYLQKKYDKPSAFIAYGATPVQDASIVQLEKFGLVKNAYNLVIARMEPENNIEPIIRAHLAASHPQPLIVIGSYSNKFGKNLRSKYESQRIRFAGPVYDLSALNSLRYYSHLYFHGHSVGGTNPSLLEAMASQALIVAHDNIFNRSVLEQDAFYFNSEQEITELLNAGVNREQFQHYVQHNLQKITNHYSWMNIASQLEQYLLSLMNK
jgi:glycosyltransferase involved in cell wall biosynthesis